MARKTQSQTQHEEVMTELADIREILAGRQHLDAKVLEHEELMNGNGKVGLKTIRDKVLGWEAKITGLILLVSGDIVLRVIQFAIK